MNLVFFIIGTVFGFVSVYLYFQFHNLRNKSILKCNHDFVTIGIYYKKTESVQLLYDKVSVYKLMKCRNCDMVKSVFLGQKLTKEHTGETQRYINCLLHQGIKEEWEIRNLV